MAATTKITGNTPNPVALGQSVSASFTVAVNAPGSGTIPGSETVTVADTTGASCTGTVSAGSCTLKPNAAGADTLTATYTGDSNFQGSTSPGSSLTVNPPPAAVAVTLTGLPATSPPGQQYSSFAVALSSPASTQLNGTLELSFTPDSSVKNWNSSYISAQFGSACANATAGNPPPNPCTLNFTIDQNPSSATGGLQVGTVAGTITVKLAVLSANGTSVLRSSQMSATTTVSAAAPGVTTGSVTIAPNSTQNGFSVQLTAYSDSRDLVSASFNFSGTGLTGTTSFPDVALGSAASSYFPGTSSLPNGGGFQLTVPFPYSGDMSVLEGTTVTVTLTNSMGTSTQVTGGVQ